MRAPVSWYPGVKTKVYFCVNVQDCGYISVGMGEYEALRIHPVLAI